MTINVYYEPDGTIIAWDNCDSPSQHHDLAIKVLHGTSFDSKTHRVDMIANALRKMSDEEKVAANLPSDLEVRDARMRELYATDWRESKSEWAAYRQALRDLPGNGVDHEMVKLWPLRPDGSDAIPHLRARVPID